MPAGDVWLLLREARLPGWRNLSGLGAPAILVGQSPLYFSTVSCSRSGAGLSLFGLLPRT